MHSFTEEVKQFNSSGVHCFPILEFLSTAIENAPIVICIMYLLNFQTLLEILKSGYM